MVSTCLASDKTNSYGDANLLPKDKLILFFWFRKKKLFYLDWRLFLNIGLNIGP